MLHFIWHEAVGTVPAGSHTHKGVVSLFCPLSLQSPLINEWRPFAEAPSATVQLHPQLNKIPC